MKSILFVAALTLGMNLAQAATEFKCEHKPLVLYGTSTDIGSTTLSFEVTGSRGLQALEYIVNTYDKTKPVNKTPAQALAECEQIKSAIRKNQNPIINENSHVAWCVGTNLVTYTQIGYKINQASAPASVKGDTVWFSPDLSRSVDPAFSKIVEVNGCDGQ